MFPWVSHNSFNGCKCLKTKSVFSFLRNMFQGIFRRRNLFQECQVVKLRFGQSCHITRQSTPLENIHADGTSTIWTCYLLLKRDFPASHVSFQGCTFSFQKKHVPSWVLWTKKSSYPLPKRYSWFSMIFPSPFWWVPCDRSLEKNTKNMCKKIMGFFILNSTPNKLGSPFANVSCTIFSIHGVPNPAE